MNVSNSGASETASTAAARESSAADGRPGPGSAGNATQTADLRQQGRLFRTLMNGGPVTARELAALAAKGAAGGIDSSVLDPTGGYSLDDFRKLGDSLHKGDGDPSGMLLTQRLIDQGPVAQNIAGSMAPDLSFAELIEKHVRRALATGEASGASRGGEVRLELSDAVLPGTALSLRKTSDGWQLSATTDNPRSREMLDRFAPALVKRFEQASLGRLEVSVESA